VFRSVAGEDSVTGGIYRAQGLVMNTGTRQRQAMTDDETRFIEIYRRFGKPIQAYCARRTPDSQVADAVADVFLVAWRRIDQVPDGDAALPWLYAVAYRVLSHQWRHKARGRRLMQRLQGLAEVESFSPDVVLLRSEEHRQVLLASARLRPIDQEILRLTLWEELSHADVALVLGIAITAVKERAYRARRNLAAEYQKVTEDRQLRTHRKGSGS
jgi:RNA polymerase sigma factor (sigma-70 family)